MQAPDPKSLTKAWLESYAPLLGRQLEGIAHLPMAGDFPNVVADLDKPTLWYSGAVCLGFQNAADIFLTWQQYGDDFALIVGLEHGWNRFALNRVIASPKHPWNEIVGARLDRLSLFTSPNAHQRAFVAAKHEFSKGPVIAHLWVATGDYATNEVGDGDDLFVGLQPPADTDKLTRVETIEG